MDQPAPVDPGTGALPRARTRCTPLPAVQLFEIAVLGAGGDCEEWQTVGWGFDPVDAHSIAEAYVSRPSSPWDAARIRHNGRVIAERRRPAA